jgi:hypothetical protein
LPSSSINFLALLALAGQVLQPQINIERGRASEFFNQNPNCREWFIAKGLLSSVLEKARTATIVDLTNPNNANYLSMTYGQIGFSDHSPEAQRKVIGTELGPGQDSYYAISSHAAQTVLLSFFYSKQSEGIKNQTFVHETLHLVTGQSHVAVANRLGLKRSDDSPFDESQINDHFAAAKLILQFLNSNCATTRVQPEK